MLKIGDIAPEFTLPATDGKELSLKDYRGKKVVLFFYPKDMTPGCTKEACSFRDSFNAIVEKGAEILGISPDPVKTHRKFTDAFQLPFLLLSDEKKEVASAYGVWKEKSFMGRKYMGVVRTTFVIDEEGKIAHIFENVKVANHTEEVLGKL